MKQYQITGLGPINADGSRKIFMCLPNPFVVTAAWLAEQAAAPDVGMVLEVTDAGALSVVSEDQAIADKANEEPDDAGAQKKSDGSAELGTGSGPSPFSQYKPKAVIAIAAEITGVGTIQANGEIAVSFADGSTKSTKGAIIPYVGDYWVTVTTDNITHDDVVPKAEFEAIFELVEA